VRFRTAVELGGSHGAEGRIDVVRCSNSSDNRSRLVARQKLRRATVVESVADSAEHASLSFFFGKRACLSELSSPTSFQRSPDRRKDLQPSFLIKVVDLLRWCNEGGKGSRVCDNFP
jgi:hypothetical protein